MSDTPFNPEAELARLGVAVPEPIELPEVPEELLTHEEELVLTSEMETDAGFVAAPAAGVFGQPSLGINPKDAVASTKVDLSVVPPSALMHLATAMMDGAAKYGPYNWRDNKVQARVYLAAALRHTLQLLDGEDFDPISLVHHSGHAMACHAIFLDAYETGNLADDRPHSGVTGQMIRRFDPKNRFS